MTGLPGGTGAGGEVPAHPGGVSGPGTGDGSGDVAALPGAANVPTSPDDAGNVPEFDKIPTVTTSTMPVNFLCSNKYTVKDGGNLASINSVVVELVPAQKGENSSLRGANFLSSSGAIENNQPACTFTNTTLPAAILANKTFPFSVVDENCPNLANGSYYLVLKTAANMPPLNGEPKSLPVVEKLAANGGGSDWKVRNNQLMWIVADNNPNSQNEQYPPKPYVKLTDEDCDESWSPLVIRIAPRGQTPLRLVLSSPTQGVLFDILGANSSPVPYTPVQISWFRNQPQFYFLALPDASGRVKGIDQLFGDNTKGPDGKFADHGFAALKKLDSNNDDIIDANDAVFAKLRMWNDVNGDGVAQSSEMFTLDHMGVVSVGLKFDSRYYETDQYGNQIKFKSIVKTASGRNQIMFDLWFHTK